MGILQHGVISGVKSLATMVAVLEWDLIFMFVGLMIVDLIVGGYKAIKTDTFKTKVKAVFEAAFVV